MKTLVIYDSFFGNTKLIADAIALEINADTMKVSDVNKDILKQYELLIVGSPIRGWRPSEDTVSFLNKLSAGDLTGVKATSFDTRVRIFFHGDAKDKINKELIKAGAEIIAPNAAFYVSKSEGPLEDGEIDRAKKWATLFNK